jgi:hypothetical protein
MELLTSDESLLLKEISRFHDSFKFFLFIFVVLILIPVVKAARSHLRNTEQIRKELQAMREASEAMKPKKNFVTYTSTIDPKKYKTTIDYSKDSEF